MADAEYNNSGGDIAEEDVYEEESLVGDEVEETEGGAAAAPIKPELRKLYRQHPECILEYVETVTPKIQLTSIGTSRDPAHKTYPFMTLYEKTKIIGLRANQLSKGAKPYVVVPDHVTDVREIARLELEQKRLPFLVKRPLPDGTFEYWRVMDLMIL
jgi:DNA-directed RNA polymerase I, II, and III subunit RPABC2